MKKLLTASVAAIALLVSACAAPTTTSGTSGTTPSSGAATVTVPPVSVSSIQPISAEAASDIQTLAGGLPTVLTALQNTGKLTTAQAAQVQKDVTLAQSSAQALAGEPTISSNSSVLTQFEGAVQDALAVANTVAPGNTYVQAATVLAPLVGVVINTVVTQVQAATSTPAVTTASVAAAPLPAQSMSADAARLILKAAAAQ